MGIKAADTDKGFLPIRTSTIMVLRGRIISQRKKRSTYLIVLKTRSGYFYCHFKEDPEIEDRQIVSIVGNPFSSNLGMVVNVFQCHVIPYKEQQSIVKNVLALLS